jgi:hypothetical protein
MTESTTEKLIGDLSQHLVPVHPLRPPVVRALLWLCAATVLAGAGIWRWANMDVFMSRNADPRLALECAATLLTGITAVVAAFYLSLPDRSSLWRYAPLPPLALWIVTSGLGCLQYGVGMGPPGARLGESPHCFRFIIMVSVPLALFLYMVLRRARPLQPLPVALTSALGVAALAAFVLQFFHPFDSTVIDLTMHAAAIIVVVGLAAAARRWLD